MRLREQRVHLYMQNKIFVKNCKEINKSLKYMTLSKTCENENCRFYTNKMTLIYHELNQRVWKLVVTVELTVSGSISIPDNYYVEK